LTWVNKASLILALKEVIGSENQGSALHTEIAATHTLVLGIGNILLSDDGVGVHVIRALDALEQEGEVPHVIALRDGGTIGLELLSEIEEFGALIAIDAMELDAEPGTVRTFKCDDMDRQLTGKKHTAHEVALADLMAAAALSGTRPRRRALVAIQPFSTQWGLSPTPAVLAAIPKACRAVLSLLGEWNDER
jgi:hydrogenase maturation protease